MTTNLKNLFWNRCHFDLFQLATVIYRYDLVKHITEQVIFFFTVNIYKCIVHAQLLYIYVYMYRNILTTFTINHPWTEKNDPRKHLKNSRIVNKYQNYQQPINKTCTALRNKE